MNLPAWSEPFTAEHRAALSRLPPLASIDRAWAWGGADGSGVRVAVIDSGIERDHPDVGGMLAASVRVELVDGEPRVVDDPEAIDVVGHGTACAGIIHHMAPGAELLSVRVLGPDNRGKGSVFAEGLAWAIDHRVQVVNLSLSSRSDALYGTFHELADEAYFAGVLLVCAANNVPGPSYPSLFSSVISVAAHDLPDEWAFFYNPAPPVEFGARGLDVPVAWKDGGHSVATGNSFAAPHVTGLAALILSRHPGATPFEVKTILAATANRTDRSG
jgi:subtilisin